MPATGSIRMTALDTWLHALDSAKYARAVLIDRRAKLEACGAQSSELARNAKLIAEADASISVAEASIARLVFPLDALLLCEGTRPPPGR